MEFKGSPGAQEPGKPGRFYLNYVEFKVETDDDISVLIAGFILTMWNLKFILSPHINHLSTVLS